MKNFEVLNVIILIKSAFNKDKNKYFWSIFLEKDSHELPNDNKQVFVKIINAILW